MNKIITHLFLRAAALLTLMLLTILTPISKAWAQTAIEDPYNLTLEPNYDGGPLAAQIPVNGPPYTWTLSATVFTRTDYTIIGWAETADGAIIYGASEQITLTGDLTLYAKWAKTTCNVDFDANGGTGTMNPVSSAGQRRLTEPSCICRWLPLC